MCFTFPRFKTSAEEKGSSQLHKISLSMVRRFSHTFCASLKANNISEDAAWKMNC
jgi:hypothetical protein